MTRVGSRFFITFAQLSFLFFVLACAPSKTQTVKKPTEKPAQEKPKPATEEKAQAPSEPVLKDENKTQPVAEEELSVEVKAPADEGVYDSPRKVIISYTEELKLLIPKDKKAKAEDGFEDQIAEKVRKFFDFGMLARMSLGRHWKTLTQTQKDKFSRLFIDLIEDSYLRKSRDIMGEYTIEFGSENISGTRAKVSSEVLRDDANIDITYELHKTNNQWMIFNIIMDSVDLIQNYQSQFNSIIQKESFDGLIQKMEKKREETRAGSTKIRTS